MCVNLKKIRFLENSLIFVSLFIWVKSSLTIGRTFRYKQYLKKGEKEGSKIFRKSYWSLLFLRDTKQVKENFRYIESSFISS